MRRDFLALVGGVMASVIAATAVDVAEAQDVGPRRIDIQYVAPTNALHLPTYQAAMSERVLEKLQEFFSPLRLPRRLLLKLEGCDGVSNAWYENDVVSVCYEYIYDATVAAKKRSRPASLDERDVIAGAFFDVFLHEVAHAVFDFLNLPVLGREEDAADQVAAYVMLSFGKDEAVRLTTAAMYLYAGEAGASTVRHFKRLRMKTAPRAR